MLLNTAMKSSFLDRLCALTLSHGLTLRWLPIRYPSDPLSFVWLRLRIPVSRCWLWLVLRGQYGTCPRSMLAEQCTRFLDSICPTASITVVYLTDYSVWVVLVLATVSIRHPVTLGGLSFSFLGTDLPIVISFILSLFIPAMKILVACSHALHHSILACSQFLN